MDLITFDVHSRATEACRVLSKWVAPLSEESKAAREMVEDLKRCREVLQTVESESKGVEWDDREKLALLSLNSTLRDSQQRLQTSGKASCCMPAPKQQWDDATLTSVTAGIETKCRKLSEARRTVRKEKRHKLITRVLATMLAATLVIALAAWAVLQAGIPWSVTAWWNYLLKNQSGIEDHDGQGKDASFFRRHRTTLLVLAAVLAALLWVIIDLSIYFFKVVYFIVILIALFPLVVFELAELPDLPDDPLVARWWDWAKKLIGRRQQEP